MKQVFFSRAYSNGYDNFYYNTPAYMPVDHVVVNGWNDGFLAPTTALPAATTPWSCAGSFKNLRVALKNRITGGAGTSVTSLRFVLMVNGSPSTLTVDIAAGASLARDVTHTVTVAAGDTLAWRRTNIGGSSEADSPDIAIAVTFEGSTGVSGYPVGRSVGSKESGATATSYQSPWHSNVTGFTISASPPSPTNLFTSTGPGVACVVAAAGTLTRLDVLLSNAPGVGKSRTFKLYKNGVLQDGAGGTVDTTLTISDASTTGNVTFSLALVATDVITLRMTTSGTPADSYVNYCSSFTATTDGQYNLVMDKANNQPDRALDTYGSDSAITWLTSQTISLMPVGIDAIRMLGFHFWGIKSINDHVASSSYAITLQKNQTPTDITLTSDMSTTGTQIQSQSNSGDVQFIEGDELNLIAEPSAAIPDPIYTGWTFLVTTSGTVVSAGSGIYWIQPNKTNDTVYLTISSISSYTTEDRKIPNPLVQTFLAGDR